MYDDILNVGLDCFNWPLIAECWWLPIEFLTQLGYDCFRTVTDEYFSHIHFKTIKINPKYMKRTKSFPLRTPIRGRTPGDGLSIRSGKRWNSMRKESKGNLHANPQSQSAVDRRNEIIVWNFIKKAVRCQTYVAALLMLWVFNLLISFNLSYSWKKLKSSFYSSNFLYFLLPM